MIHRLRNWAFAAALAGLFVRPVFAADLTGEAGRLNAPVTIPPAVVGDIGQFNAWLVTLNSGLALPAPDLAAISLQASQVMAQAPAGATVQWNAQAAHIEIVPQTAGAKATTLALSALPQMRESLAAAGAEAQSWAQAVAAGHDPEALTRSLNSFFDRSAQTGAVVDPQARTTEVLGQSLPAHLRPQMDAGARARQQKALKEWQVSEKKTYVFVNSYSFKDDGTPGLNYYDMRPLAQILWAADKGVDVIFVTAMPVDEAMVQHVLRGRKDAAEIRKRIHFVALDDTGTDFLSQKLLDSKHAGKLEEIRGLIKQAGGPAALYPYMGGPYEWQIAKQLGIPDSVYAAHPTMIYWGTKSGGRKVFKAAMERYRGTKDVRIRLADGAEDLYDVDAAAKAVGDLQQRHPDLKKVAVKLNLGSSGEGNIFPGVGEWSLMNHAQRRAALKEKLESAKVGIPDEKGKLDTFKDALENEGAAVEQFIPGIERATFPSVQSEILPDGNVRIVSSHEQILVDRNNYIGATLSADKAYRKVIERAAYEAAVELAKRGIVGRFGTDFAAVPDEKGGYDIYYIENNIRLTGTTHPMVAAEGLTGASYQRGALRGAAGPVRYKAMDHDVRPNLKGLGVDGFLAHFDKPENQEVLFDAERGSGVLFHLLPAVKAAGNVGYTIIGRSRKAVQAIQDRLTESLNRLELEYLSGRNHRDLKYRYTKEDARHAVEEKLGHVKTVKSFAAFLERHPKNLYRPGAKAGIVFHPTGFTVIGRTQPEIDDLTAKAKGLLRQFAHESDSVTAL